MKMKKVCVLLADGFEEIDAVEAPAQLVKDSHGGHVRRREAVGSRPHVGPLEFGVDEGLDLAETQLQLRLSGEASDEEEEEGGEERDLLEERLGVEGLEEGEGLDHRVEQRSNHQFALLVVEVGRQLQIDVLLSVS